MNVSRYLFIALAFSFISAFPYKAFSGQHIPFKYTYQDGSRTQYIYCSGRDRSSNIVEASPGPDAANVEFYSAEVTIYPPYGSWTCCNSFSPERAIGGIVFGCSPSLEDLIDSVDFNLPKGATQVNLVLTEDGLTVTPYVPGAAASPEADEGANTATTYASLGDDNTKPRRDTDTFTFNFGPNPGDRLVTVTLEPDQTTGHLGEQATLILRNGNSAVKTLTGALPIEFTETIPSDGEYQLVVRQNDVPEDVRFRGSYYLSVKSDQGDIEVINPTEDVEP